MSKKRLGIIIGVVVAAVIVAVLLDTLLANHQPAIVGLEAEPERVAPSGTCHIVCNATDSDGDQLSYGWSADGGAVSGQGASVTWTAPGAVGSYNITVIVSDNRGGTVTDYLTITVRRNSPPRINSLAANSVWTLLGGSLNVTCDASDPDGDELSYEWTVTGGDISGTGAAVSWAAPQEVGVYNITVVIRDGHDRSDMQVLPLSVVTGEPPSIEALVISAEHCYLRTSTSPNKVGKQQDYQIECVVADAGIEVFYQWSCETGAISGEGSIVTWTAPNEVLAKTMVTIIVSDVAGNQAVKNLLLEVVSCNTCSFPGCSG